MLINPYAFVSYDTDALAYILAVETADGQVLEDGIKNAINSFVIGCKADGIWAALKSSCILAGARTLSGSLVPLVGAAPTNIGFTNADYNRKTGINQTASSGKSVDTNFNVSSVPQNNVHLAIYRTSGNISINGQLLFGTGNTSMFTSNGALRIANRMSTSIITTSVGGTGFIGIFRSDPVAHSLRINGNTTNYSNASATPSNATAKLFAAADTRAASVAFYSVGEFLNSTLLDARVTALINAIAAAIP